MTAIHGLVSMQVFRP